MNPIGKPRVRFPYRGRLHGSLMFFAALILCSCNGSMRPESVPLSPTPTIPNPIIPNPITPNPIIPNPITPNPFSGSDPKTLQQKEVASTSDVRSSTGVTSAKTVLLDILVTGFASQKGTCRLAIFVGPEHFNDVQYAIERKVVAIDGESVRWQLELPNSLQQNTDAPSMISVSAYHDANENSRLDKSSFGIPMEAYGFSKNPKRGFGPPKFTETAILVPWKESGTVGSNIEIPIQLQ